MSQGKNRGRGIFFLFLILAALSGAVISFFPLVELYLPNAAEKIHQFRGYYTGPLFTEPETGDRYFTEKTHGFKSVMEKEQVFYFIPAADINFNISAYYEFEGNPIELYLYESDDPASYVATNLNVPYAAGRQADALSQQGSENPEHANWFNYECKEGVSYTLKVLPKTEDDIGTDFTVYMEVAKGWISLQGLWGFFVGILFVLLILSLIIRIILKVRR